MPNAATKPNKIRYGFKNVYYAVINDSNGEYGTPVQWLGGRSISLSPEGDTSSYYADDNIYVTNAVNNGYSGTLTMAKEDDAFLKDVMGHITTANGNLAEDAAVTPKAFALLFECQGDVDGNRYAFFRVVPGRANFEANTKEENISPDEVAVPITIAPVASEDGHLWISSTAHANDANYSNFFSSVTLPTVSGS